MEDKTHQRLGRKVYVPLTPAVLDALREQAIAEQRAPVGQAAVLISNGLKAAGYLAEDWRPGKPPADRS